MSFNPPDGFFGTWIFCSADFFVFTFLCHQVQTFVHILHECSRLHSLCKALYRFLPGNRHIRSEQLVIATLQCLKKQKIQHYSINTSSVLMFCAIISILSLCVGRANWCSLCADEDQVHWTCSGDCLRNWEKETCKSVSEQLAVVKPLTVCCAGSIRPPVLCLSTWTDSGDCS